MRTANNSLEEAEALLSILRTQNIDAKIQVYGNVNRQNEKRSANNNKKESGTLRKNVPCKFYTIDIEHTDPNFGFMLDIHNKLLLACAEGGTFGKKN
jgi:hypothetical protein